MKNPTVFTKIHLTKNILLIIVFLSVVPYLAFSNSTPAPDDIGDFVWEDTNGNGIQDAGEPGIENVEVKLFQSDGTEVATTSTDASGHYVFTGVVAGDYYINFNLVSSGYDQFTEQDVGGDDAIDSDVDSATGNTDNFTVSSGSPVNFTYDAGIWNYAEIGDYCWEDGNHDGKQDAGEYYLGDVEIHLIRESDGEDIASVLSQFNGIWTIENIPPGEYHLEFFPPDATYISTLQDIGNDDLDSDIDDFGVTDNFTLLSGQSQQKWDAGYYIEPPEDCDDEESLECIEAPLYCDLYDLNGWCSRMHKEDSPGSQPNSLCPTGGGADNISWWSFVAGNEEVEMIFHTFNCFVDPEYVVGVQYGIYTSCDFTEAVVCEPYCQPPGDINVTATGLIMGHTYYLFLDGCNNTVCDYWIEILSGGGDNWSVVGPSEIVCDDNYPDCENIQINEEVNFTMEDVYNATTYIWDINGEIDSTYTPDTTIIFDTPGTYQICAYGTNDCDIGEEMCIEIEVCNSIVGPEYIVCDDAFPDCEDIKVGEEVTFTLEDVINATTYIWNVNGDIDSTLTIDTIIVFDEAGTFEICAFGKNDCDEGEEVCKEIEVCNGVIGPDEIVCDNFPDCEDIQVGDEVTFTLKDVIYATSYVWSVNGDVDNTSFPDTSIIFNEAGTYEICSYGTNDCDIGEEMCIEIEVYSGCVDVIGPEGIICNSDLPGCTGIEVGEEVLFTLDSVFNALFYVWNINGIIDTTNTPDTSIYFTIPGSYHLCAFGKNDCDTGEEICIDFEVLPGCIGKDVLSTQQNNECSNSCAGNINIVGIEDYNGALDYLWSTGDTNSVINGLCNGYYYVSITDTLNCTIVDTFYIVSNSELIVDTYSTNETSNGASDGTAIANPSGGIESYTYLWSNGGTTKFISGLAPGQYIVTVTDSVGCIGVDTTQVQPYNCLDFSISSQSINPTCFGDCDGVIAITNVSNTTGVLKYKWSTGDSLALINNLCVGTYTITITDETNCSSIDTFILSSPDEIVIGIDTFYHITNSKEGAIFVSTYGNYTFAWTGPEGYTNTTEDILNLDNEGCYTLVVTDTLTNCTADTTICINDETGIFNISIAEQIDIFPNPAKDRIYIDFDNVDISEAEISIYDMSGKKQFNIHKSKNEKLLRIDANKLQSGLYLIEIKSEEGIVFKKVIVGK